MIYLYHHADCNGHEPGSGHPECPERIAAILKALRAPPLVEHMFEQEAPMGTESAILLAHTEAYRHFVKASAPDHGTNRLDPDTVMSQGSLAAVMRGVGAATDGVRQLLDKTTDNVFCLTRPPGHHATAASAMGFCIFNFAAIAALYAQQQFGLERIAIVDFDVHHGNGTQDILSRKPGLLYISTHQSPLYPGTGSIDENLHHNIFNVPLKGGTNHAEYKKTFTTEVMPLLADFKPQLLIVSAGFDAHINDPLAGLALTEETYHWLGKTLRQVANQYAQGRLLSILEGGYQLDVLGACVKSYLMGTITTTA